MGDEVVKRGGAENLTEMARERIHQDALVVGIVEDEMDGRGQVALGVGRGDFGDGRDGFFDPGAQKGRFAVVILGRSQGELDDRAAAIRIFLSVLRADHQRADQVDAVEQIVVLDIDIDLDQIGMEFSSQRGMLLWPGSGSQVLRL